MPDFGSATFSQTDASNNSGTMPSWSGSAAPSTLDDAGRALQGAATREWNWRSYTLTAGGSADAKTLSYSVAPAAYYNGQRFAFIANTTNTTSATLNVNSLGAKTIKKDVSGTLTNLLASDMVSGMFVEVAYNTANDCFVWVNQNPSITGSANTWSAVQTFTASPVISVTDNTNAALRVTQLGTGLALRIEDEANPDSTPFVVDASGNVGIGTSAPQSILNTFGAGQTTASMSTTSSQGASIKVQSTDGAVGSGGAVLFGALQGCYGAIKGLLRDGGNNTNGDIGFSTRGPTTDATLTERLRIESGGNILNISSGGLGYGTGSGGTVTQLTSKSTGVTLNKTNGQITMNAAALANGASVAFNLTNSTISNTDLLLTNCSSNSGYTITCTSCTVGSANIRVTNVSGGSLSEALVINFAVIKAVTA